MRALASAGILKCHTWVFQPNPYAERFWVKRGCQKGDDLYTYSLYTGSVFTGSGIPDTECAEYAWGWRSPQHRPLCRSMDLRISAGVERPAPVTISIDGQAHTAYPGELLATALLAAGIHALRRSPKAKQPRGLFCLMGVCQECLVKVDGRRALACQTNVYADMQVSTDAIPES